jgi:RNA ligase
MDHLYKYPRTQHLEGSRFQPGDEDLSDVAFFDIAGRPLVVEEKLDGANAGISFDADGRLFLQSRGHFLLGGKREIHFDLFKQWASTHSAVLRDVLGTRFVLYGEWLYAKHTVFYDALPHYFMEFDILDTERMVFLDTPTRHAMLAGTPVVSVPVVHRGTLRTPRDLAKLLTTSLYITETHRDRLRAEAAVRDLNVERALRETDPTRDAEGLYVKLEEDGEVKGRYKFIRASFLQSVEAAEGHWLDRPIIPNGLRAGTSIFESAGC